MVDLKLIRQPINSTKYSNKDAETESRSSPMHSGNLAAASIVGGKECQTKIHSRSVGDARKCEKRLQREKRLGCANLNAKNAETTTP